jgi:hypothetical protein
MEKNKKAASNAFCQLLILVDIRLRRPEKAEPSATLMVSLSLGTAAIWIGWHAIGFITTPH